MCKRCPRTGVNHVSGLYTPSSSFRRRACPWLEQGPESLFLLRPQHRKGARSALYMRDSGFRRNDEEGGRNDEEEGGNGEEKMRTGMRFNQSIPCR